MALRFWGNSKSDPSPVQIDDLAWFENSVHGGVVILGIFRDAIAMSPSLYVKQIAEKTLSIIKAIAIAAIGDTGSLKISLQKLGEATAAVTATILQSYLESRNRDGWPGSQLQGILEDLIKTLDTIEAWVSSGQVRNSMGRTKCVKMVKEFQEQLSEVLEQFELASLLRSYSVFPFIKKMIEDYAVGLDAGAAKLQSTSNADDLSKASPESEIVEQNNLNLVSKQQKDRMEKETHDALKVKVRLILRIIEKEERNQQTSRDKAAPANQNARGLDQYPRELEKEHQITQRDEVQGSRRKFMPEADDMGGDHDNMEQDAVEMLYDILMARLSNVAIPGPKLLSPTFEQPKFSLPSPLPPSYTASTLSQSTASDRLSLEKSPPSFEPVDTSRSQKPHGYIPQAREVEHPYGQSKPFNQGINSTGFASLPPGAMPPKVSTVSLLSIVTSGSGRTASHSLAPVSIRPERSLTITPLPDIGEGVERGEAPKTLGSPAGEERKPMAFPIPLGEQEYMQSSRPSISADHNQRDKPTHAVQRALDVTLPMPTPYDNTGRDKALIGALYATRSDAVPGPMPFLPASTGPDPNKMPSGPPQALGATRPTNALPGPAPFFSATGPGAIKMPNGPPQALATSTNALPGSTSFFHPTGPRPIKMPSGSPPLPPGAMPPKPSSWLPPSFGKDNPIPQGHRLAGPGPTLNPIPQSDPSLPRQPGLTLNGSSLRTTNSGLENKEGSIPVNYHLPPITMPSPLTLAPLVIADSKSSHSPRLPPPPPVKRPEHLGPGENLRKMSPHMQRYIERLADRIWGGSEGGR